MRLIAVLLGISILIGAVHSHTSSEHDHDHESSFEYIGLYSLDEADSNYGVQVATVDGTAFDEESCLFLVIASSSADSEGLEEAEEEAETVQESASSDTDSVTVLASGDTATPGVIYNIDLSSPETSFDVQIDVDGAYTFFLEHGTSELSLSVTSPAGEVLTPVVEEGGDEASDEDDDDEDKNATAKQWFESLGAALAVSLCSFTGIIFVAKSKVSSFIDLSYAQLFACGTILTTSLVHIIPEALEGLEEQYPDLHYLGIRAGVAILAGVFGGILLTAVLDGDGSHSHDNHVKGDGKDASSGRAPLSSLPDNSTDPRGAGATITDSSVSQSGTVSGMTSPMYEKDTSLAAIANVNKGRALTDLAGLDPVCWNVIIGDFFHNFGDGVTIGAAFLSCSSTIGWTVTASAMLHEIPHEFADFFILVNGGMSVAQALTYNFISALSAFLGVIVILSLKDKLSDVEISFILLIAAGNFIFIALSDLLPQSLHTQTSGDKTRSRTMQIVCKITAFVTGCLVLAIPLLFDQHCDDGDGHDHR